MVMSFGDMSIIVTSLLASPAICRYLASMYWPLVPILVAIFLAVTGVALGVFLYVGAMFLQGYFYTEPSEDLYWQAPAAAGVLTALFAVWCILIANTEGASPSDVPYDTLFRFSARTDLFDKPAAEMVIVTKTGDKKVFKRKGEGARPRARRTCRSLAASNSSTWTSTAVY